MMAPRIVSVSAGGHSIYVTFDQPMLSWSGDGEPPGVRIEPAFDCRWSWSDDRWLSCDAGYPGTPLKRAQRYRLVVGPGLWSQQGQPLPPQSLLVDSDRPTIDARTDWSDRRHPVIELSANVPLREPQLREVLLVSRTDGSAEAYTLSAVPHVGEDAAKAQNWRLAFDPNADDRRVAMFTNTKSLAPPPGTTSFTTPGDEISPTILSPVVVLNNTGATAP